jgi:DNA-directed RNA polymerase specialized sigma24 family protein
MKKQATINRLGSRARRYLRRLSSLYPDPPISTEDIEHQSFIVFCKLLEEWSPESMTFSRFLIARMPGHLQHFVRDAVRPARRGWIPGGADDYFDSQFSAEANPEDLVGTFPSDWDEYTSDLPYRLKVGVTLRYWADLPSAQIALMQGQSKRNVDRDLRRALASIKRQLQREAMNDEQKKTG